MEHNTKRYWKGLEELRNDTEFVKNAQKEFADFPSDSLIEEGGTARRDFLKMLGFGVAAVSLAACESPVKNAIPYLNKPEEIEPTIANWYASTFTDGGEYCSVLVKTREGRPIKIEGNPLSGISKGGVGVRAHASVLSLYDNEKLKGAQEGGKNADWAEIDKKIVAQLAKSANIRIVSNTILSPSTKGVIQDFSKKYPSAQHISYDAASAYGLSVANGGLVPSFDFSKAKIMVGLSCDFLGTWISPDVFSKQWAETRKLGKNKKEMSRHYQFESILSLTGANADYRAAVKPSQEGMVAVALHNKLTGQAAVSLGADIDKLISKAAQDLIAHKGAALVVSGSNDANVQAVVSAINTFLGSYGTTIDLGNPVKFRQGDDKAMNDFINEVKSGKVDAVIFYGANPVYDHPRGKELGEALSKVALSISMADRADETASLCKFITPDSHYLESWNDAEPKAGFYSIGQPTISTIFKTRQAQSSLLTWAGQPADYADYLRRYWAANILKTSNKQAWFKAVHDGVYEVGSSTPSSASPAVNVAEAVSAISKTYKTTSANIELVTYEKVGIGTGSQANNPWLQEFPDPISKACWDNYAAVSQKTADKLGIKQNDLVKLEVSGKGSIELPVLVQPGQAHDTVAVAIGYGRTKAGKAANGVGQDVYPFVGAVAPTVTVTPTGSTYKWGIAQTQSHQTVMGRTAILQEATLAEYVKSPTAGKHEVHIHTSEGLKTPTEITLWNGHERKNHSWGMVIDLNTCNGCGACVVSCQAENNVAVVGRKEIVMKREMHWIRIDRYYSSDADPSQMGMVDGLKALEIASENPEVAFQPMMCQHCNNAPCETVCPVLATTHSSEGLNQMTYNRCIGTRYCANNCPYKVRRFNWFKYFNESDFDFHFNNDLGRMVINPDVTVRSRGVMEKCSLCVQRIQAGKLEAKKEKRRPGANEIQTACSQSCPTGAIVFGDMNDPDSEISQVLAVEKEGRAFHMLEEINVLPQVSYLTKIRNKDVADHIAHKFNEESHGGHKHADHAGHDHEGADHKGNEAEKH